MATVRGRGRGGAGAGAGGPRGGALDAAGVRRGSWRGGPPPGSAGYGSRGASPGNGGPPGAGAGAPSGAAPRQSINDHMNDVKKVSGDKPAATRTFQIDTDISTSTSTSNSNSTSKPRELQPWVPDAATPPPPSASSTPAPNGTASRPNGSGSARDSETFGGEAGASWDQFATNARLFGTKTSYQEEIYTTKLNKAGPDFRKREKEAERLAAEIMGGASNNPHVSEERNQIVEDWTKDEEEKYSGVVRNPNAYVPPAARRTTGSGAVPSRPTPPLASNVPAPAAPQTNGGGYAAAAAVKAPAPAVPAPIAPSVEHTPAKAAAEVATPEKPAVISPQPKEPSPLPSVAVSGEADAKDAIVSTVVDSFRQFVGTERERAEAKKQSIQRTERDRIAADLKKFQVSFKTRKLILDEKVPMPMPKDILPILSKDAEKQKAMEARALESSKSPTPSSSKATLAAPAIEQSKSSSSPHAASRKIAMKIQEIPPFNFAKRAKPPSVPVPETAGETIQLAVSPAPSAEGSQAAAAAAKLNPNASSFVFKPNPSAAAFKPGQPSSPSPASRAPQLAATPSPAAGPSVPKNPFFRDGPPQRIDNVRTREDFNPWKHGQVPSAASVLPTWPYTGRKYNTSFNSGPMHHMGGGGGGMMMPFNTNASGDDDPTSSHHGPPHMMQGMPPNFPPYYNRYQSQMGHPQGLPGQMQSPMFSPGPGYAPLPGQGMQGGHMGGGGGGGAGPQPNGMPMYYPNGMPQNPQFLPQHMQFNPNSPHRGGPGGPGGPAAPMYGYGGGMQVPTPQQTPQMHHPALQPPPPPSQGGPPYQASPMQSQGSMGAGPGAAYDSSGGAH